MSVKANISEYICHLKSEGLECVDSYRQRRAVLKKVDQAERSVLKGKPGHKVASLKTEISPTVSKESFVPFWKLSSGGHFVWKHHSRPCFRFLWKTTGEAQCVCVCVCVSASQRVYWLVAPQLTTPSMCVSGVEVPQEWECLSTLRAGNLTQLLKNVLVFFGLSAALLILWVWCCSLKQQKTVQSAFLKVYLLIYWSSEALWSVYYHHGSKVHNVQPKKPKQ